MHIFITGVSGLIGSRILVYFLRKGHTAVAVDHKPIPAPVLAWLEPYKSQYNFRQVDLLDYTQLDVIFDAETFDGVVHLAAIPDPLTLDNRLVHNNNVVSSYNVLRTAAEHGVKRIVQASSVHATGLNYAGQDKLHFHSLPLRETEPHRPIDAYALSKTFCEVQAQSLVALFPGLRIASLRFHMCCDTYEEALRRSAWQNAWSWTAYSACAQACLKALISEGWEGAEAFFLTSDELCWEGGVRPEDKESGEKAHALDLLRHSFTGQWDEMDESWWAENPRRGFWDSSKAKKLLGWDHEKELVDLTKPSL